MVVVTEVVKAKSSTIIISNSKDAQINLIAKAEITPKELNLANSDAKFQVLKKAKIATQIIASKGLTPLFRASGIVKHIIGRTGMYYRKVPPTAGSRKRFARLDYSDFE